MAILIPKEYILLNSAINARVPSLELVPFSGGGTSLPAQSGQAGKFLSTDGTTTSWASASSLSIGGSNTQVQFNNNGVLGGSASLTWNGTQLKVDNIVILGGSNLITNNEGVASWSTVLNGGAGLYNIRYNSVSKFALTSTGVTTVTPDTLTGSTATSALDISQTWNTTGTPTAFKLNITDTASNAASLLADFQVAGTTKASITKTGLFRGVSGGLSAVTYGFGPATVNGANTGIYYAGTNTLGIATAGGVALQISGNNAEFGGWDGTTINITGPSAGAGNADRVGEGLNLASGKGTGNGTGGNITFQTSPGGTSGSSLNAWVTRLTINGQNGQLSIPTASIVSTPIFTTTGSWFTGGTSTTTKPNILIEPTGTTSTGWNTAGTGLGINAASGFTGSLIELQVNAGRALSVTKPDANSTEMRMGSNGGDVVFNVSGNTLAIGIGGGNNHDVTLPGANFPRQGAKGIVFSDNGVASKGIQNITGTWFTGGTSTTTKPALLIEPTSTTSTNWSTSGTGMGINAASGFAGNLLDLQVSASSVFRVSSTGAAQSLYHRYGAGSPEGVVTAPVGCIYSRTDGGLLTSLYVKESGAGNTGWIAK